MFPPRVFPCAVSLTVIEGWVQDYGNSEITGPPPSAGVASAFHPDIPGQMEAINFGTQNNGPTHSGDGANHPGAGVGPWVMADLENGVWAGNRADVNPTNTAIHAEFVTALLKGRAQGWALKGGDAQGGRLRTLFDGPRPPGYSPMKKQGAIVLGIGGDNSDFGIGTFYEGVMTAGYTTDATDDAVQANIVAARYGR